ncbi:putative secreted hydrolase [Leptolyngbyaceae cyanobacterium JSC-12]|nr:putative secreted hydrolase [Leptolyngbyaceae cyanobacterium JSC-12]
MKRSRSLRFLCSVLASVCLIWLSLPQHPAAANLTGELSNSPVLPLITSPKSKIQNPITWQALPAIDTSGFEKAIAPRIWHFPEDFGAHETYQTEWWYYTGNLETAEGREFGFQLTFFRQALHPPTEISTASSHWRSHQIYSAHFTISDIASNRFYPYERFSRGVVQLAGAQTNPYHVWLEDWSATEIEPGVVRLQAQTSDVALDLTVKQTLLPVLQGDRGLSIKGAEPGNASYYYSLVQQPTHGTITINGKSFTVSGLTWKDHEYSTSSLSPGTVGWDWFSLQFNNGSALMLYLLRHEDGTPEPTSAATFISSTGELTSLTSADWTLEVLNTWKSPQSQAIYPAKWALQIPRLNLTLQGQALMPNQELNTSTATYWEGAVAFQGTLQNQPLQGKGYVELTGYADRLDTILSASAP